MCSRFYQLMREFELRPSRTMRQSHAAEHKALADDSGKKVPIRTRGDGQRSQGGDLHRGARTVQPDLRQGHLDVDVAGRNRRARGHFPVLGLDAPDTGAGQSQERHPILARAPVEVLGAGQCAEDQAGGRSHVRIEFNTRLCGTMSNNAE